MLTFFRKVSCPLWAILLTSTHFTFMNKPLHNRIQTWWYWSSIHLTWINQIWVVIADVVLVNVSLVSSSKWSFAGVLHLNSHVGRSSHSAWLNLQNLSNNFRFLSWWSRRFKESWSTWTKFLDKLLLDGGGLNNCCRKLGPAFSFLSWSCVTRSTHRLFARCPPGHQKNLRVVFVIVVIPVRHFQPNMTLRWRPAWELSKALLQLRIEAQSSSQAGTFIKCPKMSKSAKMLAKMSGFQFGWPIFGFVTYFGDWSLKRLKKSNFISFLEKNFFRIWKSLINFETVLRLKVNFENLFNCCLVISVLLYENNCKVFQKLL